VTGRLFFGENFGPFAGPGGQATAVVHGPTAEPGIVPLLSSKVARSFPRRQTIRIMISFPERPPGDEPGVKWEWLECLSDIRDVLGPSLPSRQLNQHLAHYPFSVPSFPA